jgi:hypothetical protein
MKLSFLVAPLLLGASACAPAAAPPTATATANGSGITFTAKAVGPLTAVTPLQIVSVFPFDPGETLLTPATEVASFLGDARTKRDFGRDPLQAVVVTPTPPSIKAEKLLVLAWGPRAAFSVERAREMGHAAMRETLKLDVTAMAYAPIARDQGVTSLPADVVAEAFVEGAMREYLAASKSAPPGSLHLQSVTYEAGPQFVDAVSRATTKGVDEARAHS